MSKCTKSHRTTLRVEELGERIAPAAGTLDVSFGIGGKVTTPIGSGADEAFALAIDSQGRAVVAGRTFDGTKVIFAVARYNADGTLDSTFDGDGIATTSFGSGESLAIGVAVQDDNRIVMVGRTWNGSSFDVAIARFNVNGSLDTSLDADGRKTIDLGADEWANTVAIQPDGRIVLGGLTGHDRVNDFALFRLNSDGSPDNTFDGDGQVITGYAGDDRFSSVEFQPDGKIVAAGETSIGGNYQFALARYNSNGSLDPTFGGFGVISNSIGSSDDLAFDMVIQPDGKIVAAGNFVNVNIYSVALTRYLADGTFDQSFGGDGIVAANIGPGSSSAYALALQADGKLVVAGYSLNGINNELALARFHADGEIDFSFDADGRVTTTFGTSGYANAITIQEDGKIVAAGVASNGANFDFGLARVLTEFHLLPGTNALNFGENDGPTIIDSSIQITNSPNANLVGATAQIGNYLRSEDELGYSLVAGITANFDSVTGKLTLSGSASVSAYESVLRSLTYQNSSDDPFELSRSITITVDDGEPTQNIATATYTIHVLAMNDAPSFTADGQLGAILTGNTNPPGQKVSALFKGEFFDPDGDTLAGVAVIANSANAATEGTWQYSTDNGTTWFDIGTVADDATALALAAKTRIRFVPAAGYAGRPTPIGVRAVDSTYAGQFTNGSLRFSIDATNPGTTTPISADPASIETQVFPINTGGNTAPTLHGVPVSANFNEGENYTFDASATDPDVGQNLTFRLIGAPAGAIIDPDSGEFAWTPTEAQGPDTFVFNVVVTDGFVDTIQSVTLIVREVNSSPTLGGVPTSATVVRGQTLQFTATATDPDILNGLGNAFTYSLVDGPAGATIDPDTGVFAWTPADSNAAGVYSFRVRVVDDGVPAKSDTKSIDVTLTPAAIVNGDLIVGGTSANDVITVTPSGNRLVVVLNRRTIGSFLASDITGRILVRGLDGADRITVSAAMAKPSELRGDAGNDSLTSGAGNDSLLGGLGNDTLKAGSGTNLLDGGDGNDSLVGGANTDRLYGGPGDDRLSGGAGNNLLVGGSGNDLLTGGTGRDVILGGAGQDRLTGGAGEDLLLAGSTSFDNDPTSLDNIFAEWTSASTYAERISHLTGTAGGLNGTTQISATTVQNDGVRDTLTGGTSLDWYVHSTTDLLVGALASETKTVI